MTLDELATRLQEIKQVWGNVLIDTADFTKAGVDCKDVTIGIVHQKTVNNEDVVVLVRYVCQST